MKPKQLANVLIKILGLAIVVQSIPGVLSFVFNLAQTAGFRFFGGIGLLIMPLVGYLLIANSKTITERLFKEEDE